MSESNTITKENFVWRTGEKESTLPEMDLDYKLAALLHSIKLSNRNYGKFEHFKKKSKSVYNKLERRLEEIDAQIEKFKEEERILKEKQEKYIEKKNVYKEKTDLFQNYIEVLEESILEDHGIKVPDNIEDVGALRRMIKNGTFEVEEDD